MDPLRIDRRETSGWIVLTLVGVIDVATAPELRQALMEVQRDDEVAIALDLDGVEFVDSFGLGVIAGGLKRASARGGAFAVVCSRSRLVEMFELTGLDTMLRIEGSLDELGSPGRSGGALH